VTSSTELPDSKPEFHLAQVDPPHPFKSAWKTFAVAAVLVTVAIAIYYYLIQKPPDAAGELLQINYYPVHTAINGGNGDPGMQGSKESYDQLIILAKLRVRNQTNIPLFLQDISASVTLPDGEPQINVGLAARDFDRVFQAFPGLAPLRAQPFDRSATLQPGQSIEGLAVFNFPMSKQQWDARKSGDVVVSFMHQPNLLLSIPH
jgi:hypothetical protein